MTRLKEWVNGNVNKKSEYSGWWKNMDTGLSYSIFVFFMIKIKIYKIFCVNVARIYMYIGGGQMYL